MSRVKAAQMASVRGNMSVTQALSESPEGKLLMLIQPSQRTPALDNALSATTQAREEAVRAMDSSEIRINEWADKHRDQSREWQRLERPSLPARLSRAD